MSEVKVLHEWEDGGKKFRLEHSGALLRATAQESDGMWLYWPSEQQAMFQLARLAAETQRQAERIAEAQREGWRRACERCAAMSRKAGFPRAFSDGLEQLNYEEPADG